MGWKNYFPDQLCFYPERFIVFDRLEIPGRSRRYCFQACLCVWGRQENVFFKTKNGILQGPSLAIFGGAKGKSI